jgi:PqqD family protein of HPr-rel-A system
MAGAVERWRITDPSALTWREWDGEIILYDSHSGDVHRLEGLSAELFETLISAPADLPSLSARVASALDVECNDALTTAIDSVIRDLYLSGVVAPVPNE